MQKFKVGLIRVLTTEDEDILYAHGKFIMEQFPMLEVETKCISEQYEGIHNEELCKIAEPKIIALAKTFKDINMLFVSCADDPAVAELKEILDIPVIGAGEATMAFARLYGDKIGVLGITDYAPRAYKAKNDNIIIMRPEGVTNTLDLLTESGKESALKASVTLKEKGANVIAIACTGFATAKMPKVHEKHCGLPVIDPLMAMGMLAYYESLRKQ